MSAALVAASVHRMLPPPQPTPVYVTVPPAVVSTHRSLAYVVMVAVYASVSVGPGVVGPSVGSSVGCGRRFQSYA